MKSGVPGGPGSRPFWCSAALPKVPLPSPSCGVWQIFTKHLIVWGVNWQLIMRWQKREEWRSWWQHQTHCWFCILSVNGNRLQTKERHKYVWHCILPAFYRSEEQPFCAWGRMWKPKTTVRRMFGQCLRLLFGHCLMENVESRGFCLDIVWGFC